MMKVRYKFTKLPDRGSYNIQFQLMLDKELKIIGEISYNNIIAVENQLRGV